MLVTPLSIRDCIELLSIIPVKDYDGCEGDVWEVNVYRKGMSPAFKELGYFEADGLESVLRWLDSIGASDRFTFQWEPFSEDTAQMNIYYRGEQVGAISRRLEES